MALTDADVLKMLDDAIAGITAIRENFDTLSPQEKLRGYFVARQANGLLSKPTPSGAAPAQAKS